MDFKFMNAFNIVYSQFWNQFNVDFSFLLHIIFIGKTILLIEEGETLNRLGYGTFESCFLRLAYLKTKTPKAMVEPFNTNSMIKLWMTINNNGLSIQRLSEFMNLVVIVIVLVDLWKTNTFFPLLHSWKKKQRNWLG